VEECVEPDTDCKQRGKLEKLNKQRVIVGRVESYDAQSASSHGNAVWPFSKPPIRGVKLDLHEDTNHLDLGRSGAGDVS
jgi:hypothetical protein